MDKTGRVKWFNEDKGYGFIERDDGGEDVFVHCSGLIDNPNETLVEGQKVSYNVVHDAKGPRAVNVKIINGT